MPDLSAASPSLREPTTAEIAETLLDYNECLAWAEQFKGTPFNMLAVATVAAKAAGPLLVMRSLFALAAENERLRGVLERIIAEDAQADWYYADIAREALKDAK